MPARGPAAQTVMTAPGPLASQEAGPGAFAEAGTCLAKTGGVAGRGGATGCEIVHKRAGDRGSPGYSATSGRALSTVTALPVKAVGRETDRQWD